MCTGHSTVYIYTVPVCNGHCTLYIYTAPVCTGPYTVCTSGHSTMYSVLLYIAHCSMDTEHCKLKSTQGIAPSTTNLTDMWTYIFLSVYASISWALMERYWSICIFTKSFNEDFKSSLGFQYENTTHYFVATLHMLPLANMLLPWPHPKPHSSWQNQQFLWGR